MHRSFADTAYAGYLTSCKAELDSFVRSEDRIANVRVLLFFATLLTAAFVSRWASLVPAFSFVAAWIAHGRVRRKLARANAKLQFAERLLRRLNGKWVEERATGERFLDGSHPYASDLNLFGVFSLFQRLSLCTTSGGEERLARLLLEPPDSLETVRNRQGQVEKLREQSGFRESLAISVPAGSPTLQIDNWLSWARDSTEVGFSRWPLLLFNVFVAVGVYFWLTGITASGLVLALAVQGMFAWYHRDRIQSAIAAVDAKAEDLHVLLPVFRVLETAEVLEQVFEKRKPNSGISLPIRRLGLLAELLDSRRNPFFAPFALGLSWTPHLALSVAQWRQRHAECLLQWFSILFETEAMNSLAAYAFENPKDTYPALSSELSLKFDSISHPLLAVTADSPNDLSLDSAQPVILLSGSNMSGKSTFLRMVGVNTVLGYLGLPVRAKRCQLPLVQIGCTLRIEDSLHEGKSRFYAELVRLKRIVELASHGPVLALIDEVLSGTNSFDRTVGAKAVLASLMKRKAIGIVTTHDLALMDLETPDGRVRNFHFEDQCVGSELHFDYRLRPGRLTGSSAQALMLSLGFDLVE